MAPLSEWQTGRWPGASILHASSSEPLARAAFGRLPMRHETTRPSKQSMTGLRYAFSSLGSLNSVMSVSHSSFGPPARKSRSTRLGGASDISPL